MLVHGAVQVPQDHSLHRLSCPHGTFTPPLTAQAWLSFGAHRSLPWIYVDILCANTMLSCWLWVFRVVANQAVWDLRILHFLLNSVWTLSRFFGFPDTFGNSWLLVWENPWVFLEKWHQLSGFPQGCGIICTRQTLPINEHHLSFHVGCVSSSFSFINVSLIPFSELRVL